MTFNPFVFFFNPSKIRLLNKSENTYCIGNLSRYSEEDKTKCFGVYLHISKEGLLHQGYMHNLKKCLVGRKFNVNSGCLYEGMFQNNKEHGKGIKYFNNQIIEGIWENGKLKGYVQIYLPKGEIKEKIFM